MADDTIQIFTKVQIEPLLTGLQAAANAVAENTTAMKEQFVSLAETTKLSIDGMGAAFSGLGSLLGAGILGHFIDEAEKSVLELGHLSTITGINIETLGGLQALARETGISFEALQAGMERLLRAQVLAIEGGKQQAAAFQRLGLSISDIRSLTPEELFSTVGAAIQKTGSQADVATSIFTLFGRGGAQLIPIFKEYGGSLEGVIAAEAKLAGVTREAYEQAQAYQRITADLGVELRKVAIDTLPIAVKGFQYVRAVIIEVSSAVGELTIRAIEGLNDLKNLFRGDDVQTLVQNHRLASVQIQALWRETAKKVNEALGLIAPKTGFQILDELEGKLAGLGKAPQAAMESYDLAVIKVREDVRSLAKIGEDLFKKQTAEANTAARELENAYGSLIARNPLAHMFEEAAREAQRASVEMAESALHVMEEQERLTHDSDSRMLAAHQITLKQWQKLETDAATQAFNAKQGILELEESLYAQDPGKLAQVLDREKILWMQYQNEVKNINVKASNDLKTVMNIAGQGFTGLFDGLISGTESVGQAFARMVQSMLSSLANFLIQKAVSAIEAAVLGTAADQSQVIGAAHLAAANAYASTAAIPIIGPELAPAAAGTALSETLAFGSFAMGGIVPNNVPAMFSMLHPNEMVLPAPISEKLQEGGGIGGGTTLHVAVNISAVDAASFRSRLHAHGSDIANVIEAQLRKRHLIK